MEVILALLICYIFRDYIAFFVLAISLRYFNGKMRIQDGSSEEVSSGGACSDLGETPSLSIVRKVKSIVIIFLIGYEKYLMHRIKMFPSHTVRNFVYRYVYLVDMHKDSVVYFGCEIRSGVNLHIGKGSIIGDNCILDARQGIYIGENVNLSSEVHLWTEAHDVNDPYFRSMSCNHGPIHIGNRVWLGSNVTILDNVVVGEGAVVCSGAVVTKDVLPYTIVAGIPAKEIGKRNQDLRYVFNGGHTLFY